MVNNSQVLRGVGKKCNGPCKTEKPLCEFGIARAGKFGRRGQCRECYTAANKHYRRRAAYGMLPSEYEALLNIHGGVCGICGNPPKQEKSLHIDHDHNQERIDGKSFIRGLLCSECNLGIGKFGDTKDGIQKALNYLIEYRKNCGDR